jgi:hypothetical protein
MSFCGLDKKKLLVKVEVHSHVVMICKFPFFASFFFVNFQCHLKKGKLHYAQHEIDFTMDTHLYLWSGCQLTTGNNVQLGMQIMFECASMVSLPLPVH